MGVPPSRSLDVAGVSVRFWSDTILHDLYFRLWPGELCALIGPSGSGKSTLMKVLLGVLDPSAGRVSIAGQPPGEAGPMGYVPQHDALHGGLTVRAELRFAAQLRRPELDDGAVDALVAEVARQVELSHRLDLRIRKLSGGQRKRVSVAMELLTGPPLLILDEPTSGLDPGLEGRLMALFQAVADGGRTVLVSTHAMQSLQRCAALMVIVEGHLAYLGPPADALPFFHSDRYEQIFDQLGKLAPAAWARAYARSDVARSFRARAAPVVTRAAPAGEAPSTADGPDGTAERARAELQRLKRERGAEPDGSGGRA